VAVISRVVDACPTILLTVSVSVPTADRECLRRLHILAAKHPTRVTVIKDRNRDRHLLALARHDLLIWPSTRESVGLCGLEALTAGVPVLAYNYPIAIEVLRHGKNALLIPCDLRYNGLGVPRVDPKGYRSFADHLVEVIRTPELVTRLRRHTAMDLDNRRDGFTRAWDMIIPQ
jgi:glycosyltransferase involved in cell wall biosynthesis